MHLQKLSVGSESIETLADWQESVAARRAAADLPAIHEHVTRMFPKQKEELLDGGSIYWVIKGLIQCRNKIVGLEETTKNGVRHCSIQMEPGPIPVIPTPKRPFQGWRYLRADAAPEDITAMNAANLPPELREKLVNLGAW